MVLGQGKGELRFEPADQLMAWAQKRTGLGEWGEPIFRSGLNALLDSLEGMPGLSPLGVVTYDKMIRQALVNRLRFHDCSIPRRDLEAPVIITGLPRSGTTALHRLLALDPLFHAPPLWELLDPFADTGASFRRWRTTAQIAFKNRLLPDLDQKHYTRADTAEECTLLLANSLASSIFWDLTPLDGYLEWYQSVDQRPVYVEYRRQLEVLQARHPGRRLLLKAPAHVGNLAVLHEIVPEAHLIQTHRDPTKAFFSHCSLRETLSSLVTVQPDRAAIADHVRRVFEHDLRANVMFHDNEPGAVTDVACSSIRREPADVRRGIYSRIGLAWDETASGRVADAGRSSSGPGGHRYSHDGWGIQASRVDGLFGDYRSRFADLLGVR